MPEEKARDFHLATLGVKKEICGVLYDGFKGLNTEEIPVDFALFKTQRGIKFGRDLGGENLRLSNARRLPGHRVPGHITGHTDFELKGRELLNEDTVNKCPKIVDALIKLFETCGIYNCRTFGHTAPRPTTKVDEERLSVWYQRLIERINQMCAECDPPEVALLVFDQTERGKDAKLISNFWRYTFGHELGRHWQNVQLVVFADSSVTPGIEIADITAYVLSGFKQKRKDIKRLYDAILELEWKSNRGSRAHISRGIRVSR